MTGQDPEHKLDPPTLPQVLVGPPASGAVLVLAPHADDETIGVGGTLLLHAEQGDPVDVLFLTNGITGNADGRYEAGEYVRMRAEEGRAAGRVLGIRSCFFWDYPDNYQVTENDMASLVPRLQKLLEAGNYAMVYTPHRGDGHSDHHVSAVMALRALAGMEHPPMLIGYEVWTPLVADWVVDISRVYEKKLEAAACYKSQLTLNDITRLFECLNGYRSIFLENKGGYGEALMRMGRGL